VVTENWETLAEIQRRTGAKADDVISSVKTGYANGEVICRFDEQDGVKVAEWRLKESKV
jgi:hypothetical protein